MYLVHWIPTNNTHKAIQNVIPFTSWVGAWSQFAKDNSFTSQTMMQSYTDDVCLGLHHRGCFCQVAN